jgi:hypothetical protein
MVERREPVAEEDTGAEPSPQPETSSAGGVRPPGRIGSGLWDDSGDGEKWLSAPIEDLGLSMRPYNVLRRSGLITIGSLMDKTEDELLSLRNLGRKGYADIRKKLGELGVIPVDANWDSARGVDQRHHESEEDALMTDTEPDVSRESVAPTEPAASTASPTREAIRAELESTRSQYHELLNSLSEEEWNKKSGNRAWNVRQLMWHLARGTEFVSETVGQCRRGKAPNPPAFLIDTGNTLLTRWGSRGATPESVAAKYEAGHAALVAVLDTVQDDEWQKGVTAYGRPFTIKSSFRSVTEHFEEHEADIKKELGQS